MSFGLSHGKTLDPGTWLLTQDALPPLRDDAVTNPQHSWLDPRQWFDDPSLPFELEIGSGKGTFLLDVAQRQQGTNFLGIEWAREFAVFAADRFRRHSLAHVRMLHADATEFIHWRTPTAICNVVHLYFSDPWPKKRHHKRRVVQDRFLEDAHRILVDNGQLRIVTDHDDYWHWMEEHFERFCDPNRQEHRFTRETFEDNHRAGGSGEIVGTNFERKYRREGRTFKACVLRKTL
ncbi:MAG: tRNA (guanosine(46)-N7)-methyltransferase TrmB [Planctomycetota bacterium]|jgi:tRNA (guanine-N7-)-methyltransferase